MARVTRRRPHIVSIPRAELRVGLLRYYATDAEFDQALTELYRKRCARRPAALREPISRPLSDAIAAHYGRPRRRPKMAPRFVSLDLGEIEKLARINPLTGRPDDAPAAAWATRYLVALSDLARQFGLHRLGNAERFLHGWCQRRAEVGSKVTAAWLPMCAATSAYWIPRREAALEIRWDPRHETIAAARQKLHADVDAALEGIADAWEGAAADSGSFTFPDTAPNADRDLEWLFWKLRHGLSYAAIAERAQLDSLEAASAVKKAVVAMAERVGVDRSGW